MGDSIWIRQFFVCNKQFNSKLNFYHKWNVSKMFCKQMMRIMTSLFILLIVLVSHGYQATADRVKYDISWNPKITEKLSPGKIFYHDVTIGEFMDIICPQYDVDEDESKMMTFVIYNVTKEIFHSCSKINENTTKVLSCTRPTKNTKLTIKFQTFSPNPRGFIYKPNSFYYLMSYFDEEKAKHSESNCQNKMRMKLFVHPDKRSHRETHDTATSSINNFLITQNAEPILNEQTSSTKKDKNKQTEFPPNSSNKFMTSHLVTLFVILGFSCLILFNLN